MTLINYAHLNVRSLLAHFNNFREAVILNKFDFCVVTKTWSHNSVYDNVVNIEGYEFICNDRNRHGDGVGIYNKKLQNTQCCK